MSGNGETFCSGRQFLITYKGVNRVVDNVLIQRLVLSQPPLISFKHDKKHRQLFGQKFISNQ